ncbi:hypothetical protein NGUA15_02053 [Salmonella enterica]|nr:hypothetical protein NGUA15_02053 [Salmonella enterica]
MLTDRRRVKPVARLDVDERFKGVAAIFRPLLLPDLPDAFNITLNEVGGVWLAAVGNHLNRRAVTVARHLLREIHRNHHQSANASGLHFFN